MISSASRQLGRERAATRPAARCCARRRSASGTARLGDELVRRISSAAGSRASRSAATAACRSRPKWIPSFHLRPAGDLERGAGAGRHAVRRHRPSRPRLSRSIAPARASLLWTAEQPEIFALAVDRNGRRLRRHVARRQGLPHRKRQGHGVFRSQGAVHLVAGDGTRRRALRRHGRSGQDLPRGSAPDKASCITTPASRTSPAWRSIRRAACWRAPSPTASCIASPPRTRRSCSTTRTCRRSAPSFRCPTARSTPRRWAGRSPSGRRARPRQRRATPAAAAVATTTTDHGGSAEPRRPRSSRHASRSATPRSRAAATPQVEHAVHSGGGCAGVEKSARLSHQSRQHRGDAVEFEGRKRLRPAGAGEADPVFDRCRTAASTGCRPTAA